MNGTPYTQDIEDDVFEVIESAVLAGAPTPSTNFMARELGHSKGHVERAVSRLAGAGRIAVTKSGQRKVYSIPGEEGATTPAPGGGGGVCGGGVVFDPVAANERMVKALGDYFRKMVLQ